LASERKRDQTLERCQKKGNEKRRRDIPVTDDEAMGEEITEGRADECGGGTSEIPD